MLSCTNNGKSVRLAAKEYQLMELFLRNPHQLLPKETILERVWGFDNEAEYNKSVGLSDLSAAKAGLCRRACGNSRFPRAGLYAGGNTMIVRLRKRLTLAAIAKEIAYRNAPTATPVILAAGLPLTSFGREKKAFRAYLLREGKPVSFSYEGISYETSVQDVKLFPQGYAAILQHSDLLNEPSVILADIGGWTVDIMRLDNRIPHAASCRSLELGMIRCLDEIAEQVRRSLNLSLTSVQIENVLRGIPDSMDDRVKAIIQREAGLYARRILSAIAEAGLDCRAMPVVFLGGGAGLMKRYLPQGSVLRPVILDDDKLNAQAYERLASQVAGHAG